MFVKTMLITTIWIILYDVLCKQKAGHCPTSHAVAVSFVPIQVLFDFLFDFPLKRLPIPFMIGISGFLDDSLSLTMEGSLNKYPLSLSTSL